MAAWTFLQVYSNTLVHWTQVYYMVNGRSPGVEIRVLQPTHPPAPLGNRQRLPLPLTILPLHPKPRAPQTTLRRRLRVLQFILPLQRPRPRPRPPRPPRPPLSLLQLALVLAGPAGRHSQLEERRRLRAIPRTW